MIDETSIVKNTYKSNKQKKPMSFSQKVYLYNIVFVAIICAASFALMAFSGILGIIDLSPIGTIVASAFAELGLHTGFYIWKAKYENGRKYKDVNLCSNMETEVNSEITETMRGGE